MIKKLLLFLILLFPTLSAFAENRPYTISGIVTDASNGEIIRGAAVYIRNGGQIGVATDVNGFYSLTVPEGEYTLCCSFLGYTTLEEKIVLDRNLTRSFALTEDSSEIETVVVSTRRSDEGLTSVQAGATSLDISQMSRVPIIFGERDLMKSIQLLPGVKAEGDGASGYQVRGGNSSQNLVLLDGAPVTNAGHLMGFFSAFNSDAVRDATLYKGLMPAQYGGRTASVLDVRMKDGNNQRYNVNGSIGLISAKINAEGPIKKDKASFFVAARRTYADALLRMADDYKNTVLYFYDLNAKVNYKFSERDRIFASVYYGKDKYGSKQVANFDWDNFTTTARWYHQFGNKLTSNFSFLHSSYNSNYGESLFENSFDYKVRVRQTDFTGDIDWYPGADHHIKIGIKSTLHNVTSAEVVIDNRKQIERREAWETAGWINEEWKISDRVTATAGLRFSGFSVLGGDSPFYNLDAGGNILEAFDPGKGIYKTYWNLEPRASLSWRTTPSSTVKAAYSRSTQNLHTIKSGPMSSSMDRYFLSSNLVKPEVADQYSLGFFKNFRDNAYEFSAEVYYKDMENVMNYRDGMSFSSEMEIERLILAGKGRSYGIEFYLRKNTGRFTGWISYTLSKTETQIDGISRNEWYIADNDRTHDISVVAMYDISPRWQLSATWVYNTGAALSLPSGKYQVEGETVYYYDRRNASRTPAYHRLDISAIHQLKSRGRYSHDISFGLYNAYGRYNPFMIYLKDDGTAKQISMFGIVPSISYNFKF